MQRAREAVWDKNGPNHCYLLVIAFIYLLRSCSVPVTVPGTYRVQTHPRNMQNLVEESGSKHLITFTTKYIFISFQMEFFSIPYIHTPWPMTLLFLSLKRLVYFPPLESDPSHIHSLEWGRCNNVHILSLELKSLACFHSLLDISAPVRTGSDEPAGPRRRMRDPMSRTTPAKLTQLSPPRAKTPANHHDTAASIHWAPTRWATLQPPQNISNKVLYATKLYSCLCAALLTINYTTHTNVDPLAMADWNFMLRKRHIQVKQRRIT